MQTEQVSKLQTNIAIGYSSLFESPNNVSKMFNIAPNVVHYWRRKLLAAEQLTLHGGYRWSKFTPGTV